MCIHSFAPAGPGQTGSKAEVSFAGGFTVGRPVS
jgi:hypothetical protein